MTEELQALWALHGLDERTVAIESALSRIPAERQVLSARLAAGRAVLEAQKRRLHDLLLTRRQIEKDIEALQVEEVRFQGQLPLVKKNEEYQALLHEIADRKSRRSERETNLLELMEEEQSLADAGPRAESELRVVVEEAGQRTSGLDAEEARGRSQAASLDAERQGWVVKLAPALKSRYQRTRTSLDGRAVVPILKGACGGCYRGQPPQVLQEARRGERLLLCDGCGRMLVWPPEEA